MLPTTVRKALLVRFHLISQGKNESLAGCLAGTVEPHEARRVCSSFPPHVLIKAFNQQAGDIDLSEAGKCGFHARNVQRSFDANQAFATGNFPQTRFTSR
jgi:hypothetical protein